MGRTVAVIVHASISLVAGAMYFFFVLPRWWELNGDISSTLGLILRIVTGALIGLAALPVVFTWLRTRRPEYGTPELALRLRVCSIALHVLAGVLIVGTAISEIWFSVDKAGRWLFGIYGAAAAIALLAIFAFYLAFVAELPPPAPRPLRKKAERKSRWRRRGATVDEAAESTDEAAEDEAAKDEDEDTDEEDEASPDADDAEELQEPLPVSQSDEKSDEKDEPDEKPDEKSDANGTAESETPAEASSGGLRNRRPSGKIRRPRRLRKSDGGVAVDGE